MTIKMLVMILMSFVCLNARSISLRESEKKPDGDGVVKKKFEYKGVNILSETVKNTLKQKGRNVVLDKKFGAPKVTKDGFEIAREIEMGDPAELMATQLANELKLKNTPNSKKDGDGTTYASALGWAIVNEGLKNVAGGAAPMKLKKVAKLATDSKKMVPKVQFDETGHVASGIGSMESDIGDIIADA